MSVFGNKKTWPRALLSLMCAALVLLSSCIAVSASDDAAYEAGHSAILYDINNGMPFSEANAVAQTRDGFIYAGCYGGLLRYDGRGFYRFEGLTGINDLLADSRGKLWIAANGLYVLDGGDLKLYTTADGLPSMSVRSLAEDSEGRIWAATSSGLVFSDDGGSFKSIDDDRLRNAYISNVSAELGPVVYGCTKDGAAFAVKGGELTAYHGADEFGEAVSFVYPDPDSPGKVYCSAGASSLWYGDLNAAVSGMKRSEIPQIKNIDTMLKANGLLWLCADNGIAYIDDSGRTGFLDSVPLNSTVSDVLCDHENNMWFASSRQGLMKLSDTLFTDISSLAGLGTRVVNSTWKKDGLLYVATDTGLIVLDEKYEQVNVPVSELLGTARVRAIKEDRTGCLWFCSFDPNSLICLYPDGTLKLWNRDNGLLSNYARAIFERSDGTMVLSVSGGIQFFTGGEISGKLDSSDGLCSSDILSIGEDDAGNVYLGSNGEGLYVVRDDRAEAVEGSDGLSSGVILQIKNDPQRDAVWVLTSNSMAVIDGDGLRECPNFPQEHIYDILFASDGSLWLLANNGFYIVRSGDVFSEEKADYLRYDASGGAVRLATPNSRSYVSPEGDAVVACTDGILGLNVDRYVNDAVDLLFAIPYVEADGTRYYPDEDGSVMLPSGVKRVTVYCYALSYALGDPVITYQLEGFDDSPVETKRSQLAPVSYTNLPGGSYRFVMSSGSDGTGGAEEYSVSVNKNMMLTERPAFWIGLFALALLLAAILTMFLLRRQSVKAKKKQEMERIGKELDTAAGIQSSMLPRTFPAFPDRKEFDLYASMRPAKEVGGDFYDFFLVDDDHLALAVADVSGKGVPAALFMMISKTVLKNTAETGISPSAVLNEVNAQLCDNNKNNMFVTVWLGILEISTGKLVFADGGHEKPLFRHNGSWSFIKKHDGVALALMEPWMLELDDDPAYVDQELVLEPGDVLFEYTDGVPEATNAKDELFGDERLLAAMNDTDSSDPEELLAHLHRALDAFVQNAPQFDDITMLAVRYNGSASKKGAEADE